MIDFSKIAKLKIKKQLGISTNDERDKLSNAIQKNPFINDVNFSLINERLDDFPQIDNTKAWERILEKKNKASKPTVNFPKYNWIFSSVAAIVLLLVTFVFLDSEIKSSLPYFKKQAVIIPPASSKASLELSDGTFLELKNEENVITAFAEVSKNQIKYTKSNGIINDLDKYNTLRVPRGGHYKIILSDSTVVWLNSESKIKYPVNFSNLMTREVELVYGEAYFDVSSSKLNNHTGFAVKNKHQTIRVLGTEFNLKAYKNEENLLTTLIEGKVNVETQQASIILLPNEQLKLNTISKKVTKEQVNAVELSLWKKGVFSFKSKPLVEIMSTLSRWYDVKVVFENEQLKKVNFTGVLGKNQDLEKILTNIKNLSIINNYEIENNTITLK